MMAADLDSMRAEEHIFVSDFFTLDGAQRIGQFQVEQEASIRASFIIWIAIYVVVGHQIMPVHAYLATVLYLRNICSSPAHDH